MSHKKPRAPHLAPGESQMEKIERHVLALSDRVARLETKPTASPDAIKAAVLAEFDGATLRPLSAPKDLRTLTPDTFERVAAVAWANVAKRLADGA